MKKVPYKTSKKIIHTSPTKKSEKYHLKSIDYGVVCLRLILNSSSQYPLSPKYSVACMLLSSFSNDPGINPDETIFYRERQTLHQTKQVEEVMSRVSIFNELESQVQCYARSFPKTLSKAIGAEIWDVNGKRYLDFLAGAGALNYGHNNPILKKALLDFIAQDGITHSLDLHTKAKEEFLTTLRDNILIPRNLDYVIQFTGPTGTNAVEAALKLARKVTGRTNVVSFTNGFHGVSAGALAATGNKHHRGGAGMPLSGTSFCPFDGYLDDSFDTIKYLDTLIKDSSSGLDLPAAVIVETVQGEGGLNTARIEWLQRLQKLCRKHEILLIVDDIQAGCGRTGTFFSFESAGIVPDIVTLSKSLSGYGLPLSIVLFKRDLDIWKPGEHNGTFRGNNHAFVTATAMLKEYWSDLTFSKNIELKSRHLSMRLEEIKSSFNHVIKETRGRGMMRGLCFYDPAIAQDIVSMVFAKGLIIERAGPNDEVIKCLMPLTITMEQLNEGLDILENTILECLHQNMPIAAE